MLTEVTPETSADFNAVASGFGMLALFAACGLTVLIIERAYGLYRVEGMHPLAALLRGTLQILIGGPLRLHRSRMAAVRADAHTCTVERAHAMRRHPAGRGHRHLHAVPDRVA